MRIDVDPSWCSNVSPELLLAAVFATGAGCQLSDEPVLGQAGDELSAAQCDYFAVNGKVTICHLTGAARKPYNVLKIAVAGCDDHSSHDGDYVAVGDPTCNGQGCFPAGAPYDGSVECCEGLSPVDGTCQPVSTCSHAFSCSGDASCACNAGAFRSTYAIACGEAFAGFATGSEVCSACDCEQLCPQVCGTGSQFLGGPWRDGAICSTSLVFDESGPTCSNSTPQCNCTVP